MLSHFLIHLRILALNDSSGINDFLGQIGGLIIITCAAGLIWIGLMALVMQRAAERRRRNQLGLAPLPALHVSAYNWLMKMTGSGSPSPAASAPAEPKSAAPAEPIPTPDLGMLTGDLSPIDEEALLARFGSDEPLGIDTPIVETQASRFPTPLPQTAAYIARPLKLQTETPPMSEPEETEPIPPAEDVAPGEQPPDAVEVLRVWRDLSDGMLIVEIGGRQFRSLNELRSAELERRFLNVVRDLNALAVPGRKADPPPPVDSGPLPGSIPLPPTPPAAKEAGTDAAPPSLSPGSMFRQMRRVAMGQTPDPVEARPVLSIAEQIENLLQERLADLPAYRERAIHVKPSLHGGVQIEVDGTYYEGVGDVEDDDVRNLLIDVVREWEQNQ